MFLTPRYTSPLAGLKEPPARLRLAKWGRNESTNGDFTVGEKTVKYLPALQKLLGFDTVALDFEHNTVPGTEAYKADKEPRNTAANVSLEVVPGEGIFATHATWTPHGIKSITEGLHPDISPTIKTDESGEVVFIHSAALCRQGAVLDLKAYTPALDLLSVDQLRLFSATLAAATTQPTPAKTTPTMDYKQLLILILGLNAEATDADIQAAAKSFAEKTTGEVKAMSAKLGDFTTKFDALQKRLDTAERGTLIAQAVAAGKIVPHGAGVDALDNATFAALLKDLPEGIVPLSQRTPEGMKTYSASATAAASTGADEEVRKQMGISKDKWGKASKDGVEK